MRRHLSLGAVAAAALLVAAGCGEPAPEPVASPATSSPGPPSSSPSAPPVPVQVTSVVVTITKGRVRTPGRRVKVRRGAKLRITVTCDVAEEFHLHGYDRTMKLAPGRPAALDLTADVPGVFEAELHGSGARLFELQVG